MSSTYHSIHQRLVPFKESHVRYEDGDLLGWLCAVLSLAPLFAAVYYPTVVLHRRDVQTLFVLAGQCIAIVVAHVLKKMIAQPRPADQRDLLDYGMPSSHSVFAAYFGTVAVLQILKIPVRKLAVVFKVLYVAGVTVATLGVAGSRVYLRYHTAEQAAVGVVVGSSLGVLWTRLLRVVTDLGIFRILCNCALFRFLRIRDYSRVDYAAVEEYEWMRDEGNTVDKTAGVSNSKRSN